jgi:predicted DNA-binding transcriptional regulator YafY
MVKSIEYSRSDDCKQGKQLRVMEVIKMLCERPVTRYRIANNLELSLRTVDRYLTQLSELGFQIDVKEGHRPGGEFNRYYLKECPLCKKTI